VPEDLVPALAHLHQSLQLGVDAPGIDLPAELDAAQRIDGDEICPEPRLLLEALLEGVHLVRTLLAPRRVIHCAVAGVFWRGGVGGVLRRSGMSAVVFLRP